MTRQEAIQEDRRSTVNVKVGLEEVCFRTVTEFRLYETTSQPVVVVTVDLG
jgi:hypothetical protein